MSAEATERPAIKSRPDWWLYIVVFFLLIHTVFFVVPHVHPGKVGMVLWYFGVDRLIWPGLAFLLFLFALGRSLLRRPVVRRWRVIGLGLIVLLALSPFAFRAYPSSHNDSPSAVQFRVPFDGPIAVGWGGATPSVNYHVLAPDQRWAYDLLVVKDGESHGGEGEAVEDYYCYGLPVLAPADGVVRSTHTEAEDMPVGQLGGWPPVGNHIVLEVAENEFLFLCHLKPGSIAVEPGDQVIQGQVLAQAGNTGNTSEPHLHIHLQDTPDAFMGEGIPLYFHNYRVDGELVERGIPTGGVKGDKFAGQIVEHAGGA